MNAKKILSFSIGPIGSALLGLITLPIIAWLYLPEDVGRLSMLNVMLSFVLLLFSLGLDQAYVREFHEVADKHGLLKSVFIPGFLVMLLSLAFMSLSTLSISNLLFGIDSFFLSLLLSASIILAFISRFLSLILRMQERGLAYSMSQLLPKLFFLLILVLYLGYGEEANFNNLVLANFLALSAVFFVFALNTKDDWIAALFATIDKDKQKELFNYGVPLIAGGIAFWGLTVLDKLFLRAYSSFEMLGIYSVAVSFAGAALVFQTVFSTVWAPVVYKWSAEGVEIDKIKNVIDHVTLAIVIIWSFSGIFSWVVTVILPEQYNQVQNILLATMAYPLLYTLSECTGIGISIKRKTIYSMFAATSALVVNAIANWLLIPIYGPAGAASATAISFFIFLIIRTESSSMQWKKIERLRMYILITELTIISCLVNFINLNIFYKILLYMIIIVQSLIFFRKQRVEIFYYILNRLKN